MDSRGIFGSHDLENTWIEKYISELNAIATLHPTITENVGMDNTKKYNTFYEEISRQNSCQLNMKNICEVYYRIAQEVAHRKKNHYWFQSYNPNKPNKK
jgi:hypothetical protein